MTEPTAQPVPKSSKLKTGCLTVAGIFAGLVVLTAIVADPKPSTTQSATDAQPPAPTKVTSVELAKAFASNEVAAQAKYGEGALEVSGTVTAITLDYANNPVIQMQGVNQFLPVQASFTNDDSSAIAKISKGKRVTVICTSLTEVASAPQLSDCLLP
jgi:tRNA_anti-like